MEATVVNNKTSNFQLEQSNCGYEVERNYYENMIHSCKSCFLRTYYPQEHCSGCSRNTAADLSELPAPGKEGRPRHCQASTLGEERPGRGQIASDKSNQWGKEGWRRRGWESGGQVTRLGRRQKTLQEMMVRTSEFYSMWWETRVLSRGVTWSDLYFKEITLAMLRITETGKSAEATGGSPSYSAYTDSGPEDDNGGLDQRGREGREGVVQG